MIKYLKCIVFIFIESFEAIHVHNRVYNNVQVSPDI